MDEVVAKLEAEYCPPLDPTTVLSISSDYDLSDSANIASARQILDALREVASPEEAAGFDPSGTGAGKEEFLREGDSTSPPGTSGSASRETEGTSLSNGLSSLGLDDELSDIEPAATYFDEPEDFDTLDEDAKVQRLRAIVGAGVSKYSIRHVLRKCKGNWAGAVEELLTQAYLADEKNAENGVTTSAKGIEGFYEENLPARGRKEKVRGGRQKASNARRSSSFSEVGDASAPSAPNKWASASEHIKFVAERTGMLETNVSSIYYSSGPSLPQTIATILKAAMVENKHAAIDEDTVTIRADDLGVDFPSISYEYRKTLVRVSYPSTTSAHDLATALTAKPKNTAPGGLQILTNYAPPDLGTPGVDWSPVTRKVRSANPSRSPSLDGPSAMAQRDAFTAAKAVAYTKAAAAHRRGRSDRLMGGAAAYYGEVGREYAARSANASAHAADQIAASQSSATQLDLHGVDVLNAVRIAQEKVDAWWEGLGESRSNGRNGADQRQNGYRIVVGLGRHSEGGKGKLGPAVTKMLKEQGWRVEPAGAVIVVKGPVKR
ncbi:hypothetical protein LTR09_008208 [Extremus antarcticus]|uniref:Smr domain-containing protein n=1 Tax=Extremus antarcticus TaxID=702011 RepID=A0AAJ0DB56_9PEZI|nr:hypothetical protein LTR09_008208 [Extremus antarcticus]